MLFYRSAEFFKSEKTQLISYYSKTKDFYFRIIIKQIKKISHKISRIGKRALSGNAALVITSAFNRKFNLFVSQVTSARKQV